MIISAFTTTSPGARHSWTDGLLAILCAAGVLAARWPFVVRGETMLHTDECIVGIMSQDIAEGRSFPMYFYGQAYMGALEAYVIALWRGVVDDPILALRLGPVCFMALLAGLQYRLLSRWFGRVGGLLGVLTLILSSPFFVQWSISARGAYIEIMVWGTLLWMVYDRYFIRSASPASFRGRMLLGLLIGSGFWLNQTIVAFAVPMVVHALMNRPLAWARQDALASSILKCLDRIALMNGLQLFLFILLLAMGITSVLAVEVSSRGVTYFLLYGWLPRPWAGGALLIIGTIAMIVLFRRWPVVEWTKRGISLATPFGIGFVIGAMPIAIHRLQPAFIGPASTDSLPMGFRLLWKMDETLSYLYHGLAIVLGADPDPYISLCFLGRQKAVPNAPVVPLNAFPEFNWIVLVCAVLLILVLLHNHRIEIAALCRLQAGVYGPAVFMIVAAGSFMTIYLMSGFAISFTSIRYLVPLWAILPGLVAAAVTGQRWRTVSRIAATILLCSWGYGQLAYYSYLGQEHSHRRIAELLQKQQIGQAIAEGFDAHFLTFLTGQQSKLAEFNFFWPRLGYLRKGFGSSAQSTYLVRAIDHDWNEEWRATGWPGETPVDAMQQLWPTLKQLAQDQPDEILHRQMLIDGYELWTLRHPLPEPNHPQ